MKLVLENGTELQVSSREDIVRALARVGANDNNFAVLSQDDNFYIQATGTLSKGFLVEYREGSAEEHYCSTRKDISHREMIELFVSYYDKKSDWKNAVTWEKYVVDPAGKRTSRKLISTRNAVILIVIGALLFLASEAQRRKTENLSQHLGQATGKILALEKRYTSRSKSSTLYVTVRFLADGKEYTVQNTLDHHMSSTRVGDSVNVIYDRRDPAATNYLLEDREEIWREYYGLEVAAALLALTGVIFFILARRASLSGDRAKTAGS